ncbi:tail protein [Caulobacter phage Lullwater]|uniref:Tail tubular protein B n=1 Tax=Caulobacter phage Lullwater TaxID=2024607 RepID=A0A291LB38_9CAUD|nr:tail protein [Caulobacter phage Lullwater]ATI16343.1 tail tubular protein B [Caulobacter phage Lullwater]
MAKVSGSYESVVRGVSEQVPQDRRPGQHKAQMNMISDPVRGLARRHGSVMMQEKVLAAADDTKWAAWLADTSQHKSFPFFIGGVEYDLLYRTQAWAGGAVSSDTTFLMAFNKDSKQFLPVVAHSDTATLKSGGVSAIVNVGKYIFLAGNTIVPTFVGTDRWNSTANLQKLAVWVRGGNYSRTYKVTLLKTDNTKVTVSYKTKSSTYPNLLDTSDIPASASDYQKQVNDRVNAYNGQVTKWIGDAVEDITPANIATKLAAALTTAGITGCTTVGATLCIDNASIVECSVEDGGDGTLLYGVGKDVVNVDKVSATHWPGKIVRVRPKKNNGKDSLYLEALAKDGSTGAFTEVTWRECAGYTMQPVAPFCIATVKSGTLYVAATPATLTSLTGDAAPTFKVNEVGDDITSPLPYFINKKIDYLGLFQDRLVIGSGAVLLFSRPGDYFNWFRSSVLTKQDDDPIEIYALGAEDDIIKYSTTYDRNMFLFGKRKQYSVNGRQPLTPSSANIVVSASHEDATDAAPQNSGNFVFYCKTRNGLTSVHQVQQGQLADTPESFNISQQLDSYIKGKPVEIVATTAPNTVFVRTTAERNVLYTYAYLDTPAGNERLFDSWSKWGWHAGLGSIVGMSRYDGDLYVYMLRRGLDDDGVDRVWLAAERFVLDTGLSPMPYADSLRPITSALTPGPNTFLHVGQAIISDTWVAFPKTSAKPFIGVPWSKLSEFQEQYPAYAEAYVGVDYSEDTFVTPTNPYMRDKNGRAIVNGRLTLGRLNIGVADTGGLVVTLSRQDQTSVSTNFNGRLLGRASDLVGSQPIVTTSVPAVVGREVREVEYTIAAKSFLPLTITAIEWTGQYFNNVPRV